jgi:myo-inositol 2-dehydrogenase/D-chiro-inositol 1-dehydrogenase
MMDRKINIALIGTGRMGSVHVANLANLVPEANLSAICDIRLEVAQKVGQENGITRVVRDYHELLDDPTIEAVAIITSTDTHAQIIRDAAKAGKHIFCEKPLALDIESIRQVLKEVEKAGVKLQVGFNRRFDKSFQRVREIVKSGELGRSCIFKITNYDPWLPSMEFLKVSGGLFLDMTIHDFDMSRFQIGEVEEVYAMGDVMIDPALHDIGDVDTAVITLKFKDGTLGLIDNSRQAVYGYDQRVETFCLNGVAMAQNESVNTVLKGDSEGFHGARIQPYFMQRFAQCYVDEMRQFLAAVRDDTPTPTTGQDGLMAVLIGHAAWRSVHEHRPVRIAEFE